jgi:hypothetical protein
MVSSWEAERMHLSYRSKRPIRWLVLEQREWTSFYRS